MAYWGLCISAAIIIYVYVGYPLLLSLVSRVVRRPAAKRFWTPSVAVLIAAHNEEAFIKRKIENILSLDYPSHLLKVVVGCDGCTDRTESIARSFGDPRVEVFAFPERRGKAYTLNSLLSRVESEVIVFTDARQVLNRGAIRELVANLADEDVGAVTGSLVVRGSGQAADSSGFYRRYDEFLRMHESMLHSSAGAAGAIYAVKRKFCEPIPEDTVLDDFVIPMRLVLNGLRVVYEPNAKAYDIPPSSLRQEMRRKIRTLAGNYQALWRLRLLLVPGVSPVWWQVASHKLGRLVVPFAMIGALAFGVAVFHQSIFCKAVLMAQLGFYTMAVCGALCSRWNFQTRLFSLPYAFVVMNWAALVAFLRFVRGRQSPVWERAFQETQREA